MIDGPTLNTKVGYPYNAIRRPILQDEEAVTMTARNASGWRS